MRTILGIDEAGRGAVLGPLVMAGVLLEENPNTFKQLKAGGVRDSKVLSAQQRKKAEYLILKNKIRHKTIKILPEKIDNHSINDLEIKHSARIIDNLKPDTAWLDVPASGRGVERYRLAVETKVRHTCKIKGGNRLDSSNVAVAAASVIAKQAREVAIKKLHKTYGDFGSGYPSDPKTRQWLRTYRLENDRWPEVVRTKWSTVTSLSVD